MPKGGKSKKKKDKSTQQEDGATAVLLSVPNPGLDDDSESVCSSLPDSIILSDEVLDSGGCVDDSDSDGELQFQLTEHIDHLSDKNSRNRLSALKYLNGILRHKLITQLIIGREETFIDMIIKGIKKIRGSERCDLLHLSSLLVLQVGEEHGQLLLVLRPLLSTIIRDHTVSPAERSSALSTLALYSFILSQDVKELESVMHEYESIIYSVKIDCIVTSAVKGWSLLLSILPDHVIPSILSSQLPLLTGILENSLDLTVKMAVGQSVALLFELARDIDEDLLESDDVDVLCGVIQSMASESNRYTGRKERSQQRSCFREILQSVESGTVPERTVKFGLETLTLDSWARLLQYTALTDLLGTGMRSHLQNNDILRDMFQLGSPPLDHRETKADKMERKLYNAACAKYRSQSRGKQRDKRAVL